MLITSRAAVGAPPKSAQAKIAKRRYTTPRLTVHGSVAELTAATQVDGLPASGPSGR